MTQLAVVQKPPVFLDKQKTIESAVAMVEEAGILYCDIDREKASIAKRTLDVAGHYSRPDIFTLNVNTRLQSPVVFKS